MGRRAEAYEGVDGERRAERRLAVLAWEPDIGVAVLWLARLVEQAVQDVVLPRPEPDVRPGRGADGVTAQRLDEVAGLVAAVRLAG